MKILIAGGTGHIGSYLVPRLCAAGHEVVSVSRGQRSPYREHSAWQSVRHVHFDWKADDEGQIERTLADAAPEVVVDLLCFDRPAAERLVAALPDAGIHLVVCGTISVYGISREVPTREDMPRLPASDYGRGKAAMEALLLGEVRDRLPVTLLHPGHIVGPGWPPAGPQGNFNLAAFEHLAHGRPLSLPDDGMATLHHVHADDVARAFQMAIERRHATVGECFNVVSPGAVTLRHYAETVAGWFGREADLQFVPWETWRQELTEDDARVSADHISRSPCFSGDKARNVLGFAPTYRSLEAVRESLRWLIAAGQLDAPAI